MIVYIYCIIVQCQATTATKEPLGHYVIYFIIV